MESIFLIVSFVERTVIFEATPLPITSIEEWRGEYLIFVGSSLTSVAVAILLIEEVIAVAISSMQGGLGSFR